MIDDKKLSRIFRAILSVPGVTIEEITLTGARRPTTAYRLNIDMQRPIVIDKMHADALEPYI